MSADFTPEKEDLKILTPFKMQVLTNFPYIEADFDALTNYQLLCKIVEYLNKVIAESNEVTEQTLSLYNAYILLQNYVNNYFDNLDLQTEIDTKLDEMAEDGTLADMIAEYIKMQGQLVYNTVADMKIADNIQNGSFLKTYGFYNYKDGGSALYKARTITNEDVIDDVTIIALKNNTLIAELIFDYPINSMQLGIKNDGETDVTEKLQNAIEIVTANKNKLILLSGSYLITESIKLVSRIKMSGINRTEVEILNNSNDYAFIMDGDSTGIEISDLSINGGSGILFTNGRSTLSKIKNIAMSNVEYGINYNCGTGYNYNDELTIRSTKDAIIIGKDVDTSLAVVSPNYIYFNRCCCETTAGSSYSGIEIDYAEYIYVNNCDFVNYENGLYIHNTSHAVTNIDFRDTTFFNCNKSIYLNNTSGLRSVKFDGCDFIVKTYLLYKTTTTSSRQVKFVDCYGTNTSGTEPVSNIIDVDYMEQLEFSNYGDFNLQTKKHTNIGSHCTYKNAESIVTLNDVNVSNKITLSSSATYRVEAIGSPLPMKFPAVVTNDCEYSITYNNDWKFYSIYINPTGASGTAYIIS